MPKEETVPRLQKWFRRLLVEETRFQTRTRKILLYLARLIALSARSFVSDLCPQRAAALSFTSVLSLVPVTALFVLYFKMAGKLDRYSDRIQERILNTFMAESAQKITDYLDQFVANLHTKTLGTLGVAGLIVTAYLVFRTVEHSLNDIWKVRRHRSILTRLQILSSILIVVPALMTASIYLSGRFQEIRLLTENQTLSAYTRTVFVALPFLLTLFTFFIIFKLVPNTTVRFKPALIAAGFASLLFELAKSGFNFYVVHVISVSKIYGTFGLIPMLLLWIYFSWLIILLGVELSFSIQNLDLLHEKAKQAFRIDPLDVPLHEEWGLRIARALADRFGRGEGPVSADALAGDLGIRASHVTNHLAVLSREEMVAEVERRGETRYVFARPVHQMTEAHIINVFRSELKLGPASAGSYLKKLTG